MSLKDPSWYEIIEIDNIEGKEEDGDGFVINTGYGIHDCEEVGGLGDKTVERINPDNYDFSKHPSIFRDKAMKILEKKFKELTQSRTRKYPEPQGVIPETNILIEKGKDGQAYVYIRIFKQILCLGQLEEVKGATKGGSSSGKKHRDHHKKQVIASLKCDIIGIKIGKGENHVEAFVEVFNQVYDDLHIISPEDFPERSEPEEENVRSINGIIDNISYTISEIEISRNVRICFTYNGINYRLTDLQSEVLQKKKYYFVAPEGADRRTKNVFRKRIGTTGKNQEDAIRKMLKNLVKIYNGNKNQDRNIIDYLQSNQI